MNIVKERANAKINLYLDVLSKNDDGFHSIKSVMHSIDLFDVITIKQLAGKDKKINLIIKNNKYLPTDSKNLAYRAAEKFLECANLNSSVEITLQKRIPVCAGLGGGSSDAAAVLRGMNRLFFKPFSQKMLCKIAAELGSDVPFCLYGKTALCEGRGEIMTLLPDKIKLNLVVAISRERVSTPAAYGELDKLYNGFDGSVEKDCGCSYSKISESVCDGVLRPDGLFNIFEKSVLPVCKRAAGIKEKLVEFGAVASLMSGSGPSVFGVFKTRAEAEHARNALQKDGIFALSCKSV